MRHVSRREFLRVSALVSASAVAAACSKPTATPEPAATTVPTSASETQPTTAVVVSQYSQAPMLDGLDLPALEDRLPENPIVIEPYESIGTYGGTWNMVTNTTPTSHAYELLCYEQLLRMSAGGTPIISNLAESWTMSDDGTTFTFNLMKGVKFSDGEPFTTADILFWLDDVHLNTDLYSSFPSWLIVGGEKPTVTAADDYTVTFQYSNPAPFFTLQIAYPTHETYLPKHYMEQFHADFAAQADLDALVAAQSYSAWTDMFLTKSNWESNQELPMLFAWQMKVYAEDGCTWERNPYYYKVDTEGNQLPYIDSIQSQVAAGVDVAQMMAFSGEAELQTFSVGQFPADTMILKQNTEMGNYTVVDAPIGEANVCNFGFNMTYEDEALRTLFRNKDFRIAMSYAVNREDIRQLIYLGQPVEIRQCAPLRKSPWYHEAAAQNYVEYDVDTANEMLDSIGLTERDADGYRLLDGQPLSIVIEIMSKRTDFIDAMEMVATNWQEVGVNTTAKSTETSLYSDRMNGNQLMAGVYYAGPGIQTPIDPSRVLPISVSNVWAPLWGTWRATDGASGEEPPAEVLRQFELYDELVVTVDDARAKELWAELMDIQAENMWAYGICDRASVPIVVANSFHNVPATGWDISWEAGNIGTTNPCQYWKEA